jgi:hypothetical protein
MFKGRIRAHGDRTFADGIAVVNDDAVLCGLRDKRSPGDHPVGRAWLVRTA